MTLLQEAVISKLANSTPLKVLLGVSPSSSGSVMEEQGFDLVKMKYPRVTVGRNVDVPMNAQQIGGALAGRQNHRVFLDVHIFDNGTTSKKTGQIDQCVREELEGSEFDYPGILVCYAEMESLIENGRDPDTGIWHTIVRYQFISRII